MKKLITLLTLALIVASPISGFGQAGIEKDPAYLPIDKLLDLKAIPPQVNVNLPRFLLKDALSGLSNASGALASNGMDIADLVSDIKLIRVVVIEANQTNRPALDNSVKALRAELEAKWTPIVSVPEENVGIYGVSDAAGDSVAGLALLIADGHDVVIANVVGHVSIGKLIRIASQSKMVPKEIMKALQGANNKPTPQPASNTADSDKTTSKEKGA